MIFRSKETRALVKLIVVSLAACITAASAAGQVSQKPIPIGNLKQWENGIPEGKPPKLPSGLFEKAHKEALEQMAYYISWTQQPFYDGDPKYHAIRSLIDQKFASGVPTPLILSDFSSRYTSNPKEPLLLFALGYAGFKAETSPGNWRNNEQASEYAFDVYDRLSRKFVDIPHNYEAVRGVFLSNSLWDHEVQLQDLGERLLQHEPNDPDVKFFTADALVYSDSPADRKLGGKYVDEIAKAEPTDPRVYLLKEDQSFKLANISHNIQDLKDCIADRQKYQAGEPKGSPDSSDCDEWVELYNRMINTWSKAK